ncbi:hypothetical protein JEZ13_09155 [bacterium]|nr:hypothetical protein [bacterium]
MKKIILFILLTLSIALYSEITIDHNEPFLGYKESTLSLDINLDGTWQDAFELVIYYRERGEVAFESINVDLQSGQNGEFRVFLPISELARGLEYFIELKTKNNEILTYPADQPSLNPIMVQIIERVISNDFVILNDLTDVEEGEDFSLSVSLFNLKDKVDLNTIELFIDGRNVTRDVIITPTLLVYNVKRIRKSFTFQIRATTISGEVLDSGEQSVRVKQKMFTYELPYNIRGSANYKGNSNKISYDNTDNQSSEESTNTHSTIFSLSGHNKYTRMNSRIYLSSLEDSNRQAVNRYSFDLRIPFLEFYLGDKTPYVSEFTMNSTNIRGLGSKLDFKYLVLEGYWGDSAREISTQEEEGYYIPGTFKRESGAIRLALGNKNAFQFGVNLAKSKDKISSLEYSDYYRPNNRFSKEEDETDIQIINPIDNIVLSTDVRLSSPSKLFNLGAEFAMSAYNSNIIDGAISQEELEEDTGADLPFDPESLDGFFIINKNTEPLSLSAANLAYNLYSSMYIAGNLFSFNYKRVGSAFNSISARNINTDTQEFTFADNINFHNTVFVDFSYSRVSDNLSENLATTNEYSNYRLNSIFRRDKFPVIRLNFNKGRTSIANNDEFEIHENFDEAQEFRTTAYGGGIGYTFDMIPFIPFSLDLDYQNSLDEDDLKNSYEFENQSYYIRYRSKMTHIPLSTEVSYNLTNSTGFTAGSSQSKEDQDELSEEEWKQSSMRFKLQYEWDSLRIVPFFDYRLTNNESEIDASKDNSYTATSLGLSYYPFKLTSLTSSITFKDRSYETEGSDYSAVNWYLNISQKF